MSFYAIIAAAAIEIVAQVLNVIAVVITAVKGNQSEDPGEKAGLRAAAGFSGLGLGFIILSMVLIFVALATRGCKRRRIGLIISIVLASICLIISLVLMWVYMQRREQRGDEAGARDLRSAFWLVIVSLILHIVAFVIFWVVIGKKFAKIGKTCRKVRKQVQATTGKDVALDDFK